MREKPVERGCFMGVISLHFSELVITKFTFLEAVLFARCQQLFVLYASSENVDVTQFAHTEVSPHMAVTALSHRSQFLEFVTNQIVVPSFLAARLWLFVGD